LLAGGVVAVCGVWSLLLALEQAPDESGPERWNRARAVRAEVAARYAGDASCRGCHPQVHAEHTASRHMQTLRPMRRELLPTGFPSSERFHDPESGLAYALTERDGRFHFGLEGSGSRGPTTTMDYAIGSGKSGMTFVSLEGTKAIRELRMSYFPGRRTWEVTPGQRAPGSDPLGHVHEGVLAQRCFACHATVLSEARIVPEERFMGVGCEGCHGPMQSHVTAARAGDPKRDVERMGTWSATRLNLLCGECHRAERDIDPLDEISLAQTQRFQPYGLMKSACFQKSGDRLSCITCHNPHRDAERDPTAYERTCRSCHDTGSSRCPVNPRDGCVGCHMPQREVTRGVHMADHWIRVFSNEARPSGSGKD
jgi:hypothetical protein